MLVVVGGGKLIVVAVIEVGGIFRTEYESFPQLDVGKGVDIDLCVATIVFILDKVGEGVGEVSSIHVLRLHAETAVRVAGRHFGELVQGIVDGTRTVYVVGLLCTGYGGAQAGGEPLVDVVVHVDAERETLKVRTEYNTVLLHVAAGERVFHALRTSGDVYLMVVHRGSAEDFILPVGTAAEE